jgi:Leucine-rich repeat (LRR) protein
MKTIYFNSSGSTSNSYISNGWTCNSYGNGSSGVCIQNNTNTGFVYSCSGSGANQGKIWDRCEVNTSYTGNRNSVTYTSWTGTSSSNWTGASSSNYNSAIRNIDEAMRKLPESIPYVRPEFIPYTQPSQPFVQPDIPHYIPPNKELSTSEKKVLITDFTKILRDLYPKDYSRHIDNWPNTLWGKQVINTKDFQAIENFFVTEFVDVLHKRYPHDYPANFKDWNSKNSQWGKEVILTKNFKTIGKWLPAYQKEVLEQQKVLKNDFVEILHRVYPEDYPMNFKDWNNIWGKEVLERGDFEAIEKHLPSYKKQALEKEQNILFLVKDESDVYLGGMSIGDYGVKLIIGGVANKLTTLNLANNKIRDEGAKLLADSLSKGQMPNLKKLHLEGNKITDKGISYFPFAIDKMNQDIKVSLLSTKESLYTSYKLSALGDKNIKKEMLVDILQKATEIGLDVDNISIDRTTWGFIKNKVKVSRDFVFGVAKCLIPKNGKELLTDMIVEKTPKIIKTPVSYLELADCASEGIYYSRLTEAGVALTKHELELLGNNSEGSVYENIFIGIKDLFDELQ